MTLATEIRKSVTASTPVYAVVGVTDLAVEKVREAQARATRLRPELALQTLQTSVQQAPTTAVAKTLETAGRAEETYDELAARGKSLVKRIKDQRATQDLLAQSKMTLSRGKAAVTTARKVVDDTLPAARSTLTTARRDSNEVVDDTQRTVAKKTTGTKSAARRTATTARKRTTTAKSTAKAATTSAHKTATAATKATEAAAAKVGD